MKWIEAFLPVALSLFIAVTATAAVDPSVPDTYDSGCVVDGSTAGCFSYSNPVGTAFNGPTVTACVAKRSNNQGCRACVPTYYQNGQPTGKSVCAYVGYTASCACVNSNTASCKASGSCTYVW